MNQKVHNQIVSFIWGIADDVLRDVFVRGKYRDIILPFTVLRRLDALLVPTKEKVLEADKFMRKQKIDDKSALQNITPLRGLPDLPPANCRCPLSPIAFASMVQASPQLAHSLYQL